MQRWWKIKMSFEFKLPKISIPKIRMSIPRGTLPRKRDLIRATNILNKRIREPIKAEIKHKIFLRAHNKCEWRGCNQTEHLHIHHKNMKNDDNRLSNLILLCPNHHAALHDKYKRVVEKDLTGREIGSRVVTKKQKENIKKILLK